MCTLCVVNPQSRVAQLVLVATVQKTKTDLGAKNDPFLRIFAIFYFRTPRWSEARIAGIVRASLSTYIPKPTPAQSLCLLQKAGWEIWKILLGILMRKLYEGLILTSTHRHNELRGQSKLTWCRVCRSHRIYTIDLRPQSLVVSELQQYNQLPLFFVILTRNVRLNLLDFNETAGSGSEVTRPLSHLSVL